MSDSARQKLIHFLRYIQTDLWEESGIKKIGMLMTILAIVSIVAESAMYGETIDTKEFVGLIILSIYILIVGIGCAFFYRVMLSYYAKFTKNLSRARYFTLVLVFFLPLLIFAIVMMAIKCWKCIGILFVSLFSCVFCILLVLFLMLHFTKKTDDEYVPMEKTTEIDAQTEELKPDIPEK